MRNLLTFNIFIRSYLSLQKKNNYGKVNINIETLNRMIEYNEKMISNKSGPPHAFQDYKTVLLKYKDYLQKNDKRN